MRSERENKKIIRNRIYTSYIIFYSNDDQGEGVGVGIVEGTVTIVGVCT